MIKEIFLNEMTLPFSYKKIKDDYKLEQRLQKKRTFVSLLYSKSQIKRQPF